MKLRNKYILYILSAVFSVLLIVAICYYNTVVSIPCSAILGTKIEHTRSVLNSFGIHNISHECVFDLTGENEEENYRVTQINMGSKIYHYPEDDEKIFRGIINKKTKVHLVIHAKAKELCQVKRCSEKKYRSFQYCLDHTCIASTCHNLKKQGKQYCERHMCHAVGCDLQADNNKKYCTTHKALQVEMGGSNKKAKESNGFSEKKCKFTGCTYIKEEGFDFCFKHKPKSKSTGNSSSSSQKNTSKKSSSKKIEMPDPDDYDSYEDFMDDWDGYMPDGSDAEDYWEDW